MGYDKESLSKWFNKSTFNEFVDHIDSFVTESAKNFNSLFNQKTFKVTMHETSSEVVIEAVLPGYKRSQIELGIVGNQFRITVEDKTILKEKSDKTMYYSEEQSSQKKERLISLPFTISKKDTKATYKDGILKISTPKKKSNTTIIDIDQ